MRAKFLDKDPESHVENSPTLFATDRTDRHRPLRPIGSLTHSPEGPD